MITEKQRQERKNYLGASDIPVLLGLSRFKTPYDLWLEKTGRVEPQDLSGNPAVQAGIHFEDGVLRFAEGKLGSLLRNQERRLNGSPIKVHTDALLKDSGEPVEAKVEGLFSPLRSGWGDEDTDEVPYDVLVQVLVQTAACGTETGYVAAFLGGRGFRLYKIKQDAEVLATILEIANTFWQNVLENIPPANSFPTIEYLQRRKRNPEPAEEIPLEVVAEYLNAREAAKAAEEKLEAAKANLLLHLKDSECAKSGGYLITYPEFRRKIFDAKRFQDENPDLYLKYAGETAYRVIRIKEE